MPPVRPEPVPATGAPSRIEAARERAAVARRTLAVAAAAAFGVGLLLVRASHPAVAHGSSAGLSAPASLVAQIQGSTLGGGSLASAAGPPVAATSTS
jgi:hypothetical protein